MKINTLMFGFIPVVIIMMGCSTQYEYSHKSSYINQPRLQVAPGLNGSKMMEDLYPIPGGSSEAQMDNQPVSLMPPGSHISQYSTKKK